MNGIWFWIPITLIALLIGGAIGYIVKQILIEKELEKDKAKANLVLEDAQKRASELELRAKNQALEIRQTAEAEIAPRRGEINREEDRLQKRREELDMRADRLWKRGQGANKGHEPERR